MDLVPVKETIVTGEKSAIQLFDKQGEHELVELTFAPPVHTVYAIGNKADVTSDVYDLLAREMGLNFGNLVVIEETDGAAVVELSAGYYNRSGQTITDRIRVRIDVDLLFQESRLKWEPPANWVTKTRKDGSTYRAKETDEKALHDLKKAGYLLDEIIYDEHMVPVEVRRKLPPEAEAELFANFLTLKKNKLQKAQTVARRTLTKRALGFKGILLDEKDKEGKWKENLTISLYSIQPKLGQMHARQSVNDIYGKDASDDIDAEVIKEHEDGGDQEPAPPAPKPAPKSTPKAAPKPATETNPNTPANSAEGTCSQCGDPVPPRIQEISHQKAGRILCYRCLNTHEASKGGDQA